MADTQALADHHSKEIVELLEDYGAVDLEIVVYLQQYEVDRKATGTEEIETVELPDSPPVEHELVPTAQGEPKSTTLAPSEPELATVLTPNPMPQREPTLAPKTEPMPQQEPTLEPTLHDAVVRIRHYVRIVRRNHRGSRPEGFSARTYNTSKIYIQDI